jgi:hypothetical protein
MPINFPDSPSVNDTHTVGDKTWVWDGTVWSVVVGAVPTTISELTISNDLTVLGDITVGGTVDGRDVATDGTKLDGIETGADVTDATNVQSSIEAITLTSVAGATGDEVLIVDATDGGLKAVLWENLPSGGGGGSPGGSDGQVQYNNGGAFGGASALYYDDVNSRVGIGTTSPSQTLQLGETSGGLEPAIDLVSDGGRIIRMKAADSGNFMTVGSASAHSFSLQTDNVRRLIIDSSGNVGINDTSPSYKLDVNGTGRFTGDLTTDGAINVGGTKTISAITGSYGSIQVGGEMEWDGYSIDGRVVFMHNGGNNWGIYNDVNNEWMLYGTLNAGVELKYNNTTRLWTDNSGSRTTGRHYTDGSNYAYSYYGHSNIAGTGNAIHTPNGIYSTGTNWLYGTVLTNGNAIGTTSQQTGDLHAAGWLRTYGQRGWYSQSYGGGWYMIDGTWNRSYNNKSVYTGSGNLRTDGQLQAPNMSGTTTYNTVRWNSDGSGQLLRYTSISEVKDDVVSITPIMEYLNERSLIYDLRPVLFHEKDQPDGTNNTRGEYIPGLIAEEVLEVAPEMCFYDENGNLISYGNDHLIPHLIAEIQRLMPMVENLYADAHPDWVAPTPRPVERASEERTRFDDAAAAQALVGRQDISDPLDGQRHLEDETNE